MLRVECESCKSPYQVDERRVPAQGLKMRCPKCGNTFLVRNPNSPEAAAPPPTAAPAAAPAEKKAPPLPPKKMMQKTMVGLGTDVDVDLPAARPAPPLGAKPGPPRPAAPIAPKAAPPPPPSAPKVAPSPPKAAPPVPPRAAAPVAPKAVAPPVPAHVAKPVPPTPREEVADPFADEPVPDLPMPARRDPVKPFAAPSPARIAQPQIELDNRASDLPAALRPLDESVDLPAAKAAPLAAKPGAPPKAVVPKPDDSASFGELDLPSPVGDLPVARPAAPAAAKPAPAAKPVVPARNERDFEIDLPTAAAAATPSFELDLPSPAGADLPSPATAGLPSPMTAGLPSAVGAALPTPAHAGLPAAKAQTSLAQGDEIGFGEIDLPTIGSPELPTPLEAPLPQVASALPMTAEVLPTAASALPMTANVLPQAANVMPSAMPKSFKQTQQGIGEMSDFGELDLPPASGGGASADDDLGFGGLDLPPGAMAPATHADVSPRSSGAPMSLDPSDVESVRPAPAPAPPPNQEKREAGGMSFGEVDLGGGPADDAGEAAIPTEAAPSSGGGEMAIPQEAPRPSGAGAAAAEVALPTQPATQTRSRDTGPRPPSKLGRGVLIFFGLVLVVGGGLELTQYGAFGRNAITDKLHAQDYESALTATGKSARAKLEKDTYPDGRAAADDALAAAAAMPRARALSAYAAFVEFSYETRFGADPDRNARAKQALAPLAAYPETPYYALALAAQDAAQGNIDKARTGIDQAQKKNAADPVQEEIALLRGELEVRAKDAAAAKTAFGQALKANASAHAHYGLARAAAIAEDTDTAKKELDATLAATPNHAGALLGRGATKVRAGDETGALEDFAAVSTGAAKPNASPKESSDAFAATGYVHLRRGRAADAKAAFDASLKLSSTNVVALLGQGDLLTHEGRLTEALARYDTALQNAPSNEEVITADAMTKVALERLKDAKDQLVAARAKMPKSMLLTYALASAEAALGNRPECEKLLRQAIDLARPTDPTAVLPYMSLAKFLAASDKPAEAKAVLDDASAKLPDTPALERALGEFLASEGQYDESVKRLKRAIELDPQDLSTHFLLGVTYRRMRQTDNAAAEFDQVLAADKDFPGLSLERGLLFEESGDTEKALEQFKNALAKAPDDPDLMLRVGAAYVAINRNADAVPMLRKVLEKRPSSAEANHYLGRALFSPGDTTQEAMRFLKRATELDPNRAEYHLYVAWAANESNSREALGLARDEVDKAYALDKLNGDIYWQRGVLERKQGAVEDALRDLKRALELKPTRIDAHAAMAECYEDKNDYGSALVEWQKAVGGDDKKPAWRYRYGKLLLERGSAQEAAKHLEYAASEADKMDVHPGWYADVLFQDGDALRRTGQRKEAIERYKKFLEVAPTSSPDRRDAIAALSELGAPYAPGP